MALTPRGKLIARLLVPVGLGLLLLTVLGGIWQTSDPLPRSLAGLFLTAFVPATGGMLLFAVAIAFGSARRWWLRALLLAALVAGCLLGGMGVTHLLVQRKLAVERRSVGERCWELRQALAGARAQAGSFPASLSTLAPVALQSCALVEGELEYGALGAAYLLALPGSSLGIGGSTFFAGPEGPWQLLDNRARQEAEQRLAAGEDPEAAGQGDAVATRFAVLWRLLHPLAAQAAGGAAAGTAAVGGGAAPGGGSGSGQPVSGAPAGGAAGPVGAGSGSPGQPAAPPGDAVKDEADTWVVPTVDSAEGRPSE